jgi:ribA/ribD-fused uncharacterized protein
MKEELRNRDPLLDTSGGVAGLYKRQFYPFSNFSSFQVEWRGYLWPTSEYAYQAAHFFDTAPELVNEIKACKSSHDAFKLAKMNAHRAAVNWDEIKIDTMYDICRAKLIQHSYIKKMIYQTGDLVIVEDSPKDSFWGWGPDKKGRNELGKIWMRLRDESKNDQL